MTYPNNYMPRRSQEDRQYRAEVLRLMAACLALVWICLIGWFIIPGAKWLMHEASAGPADCAHLSMSDRTACAEDL